MEAQPRAVLSKGSLEPHVGSWYIQDMVLVTPDGPTLLSDHLNTDEMFIIS